MDRGQVEVRLVVQLYPNQPAGKGRPVDARYYLHHGEASASMCPHRQLHERRCRPARTREIGILESPFQVVLPERKQKNEDDAKDEKANDVCVSQNM
jgi:hypothetical protein